MPSTTTPVQAPTPTIGVSTVLTGGTTVVGLVVLVLSLFGVQVDDAVTQQIGAAVGGLSALVSLVTMVISRTKQANHLAQLATDIRLDANDVDAAGASDTVNRLETQVSRIIGAVNRANELNRQARELIYEPQTGYVVDGRDEDSAGDEADEFSGTLLGQPLDPALEVPAGSVPTTAAPTS